MTVRLDRSESIVILTCTECGHWRRLAQDVEEAELVRERHLVNVHTLTPSQAAAARVLRDRRHAAAKIISRNVVDSPDG
jgi:hypothetical protein